MSMLPERIRVFPINKIRLGGDRTGLSFWHGIGEVVAKVELVLERRVREHDRSADTLWVFVSGG